MREFLNLGEHPLDNAIVSREKLAEPEMRYPLRVLFCQECGLSQLGEVISPKILFRDYVYLTSGMPRVSEHFRNYANDIVDRFSRPGGLVVEIGSNDGILLAAVKERGTRVLGIDPALNIAKVANDRGVETIPDFFSQHLATDIARKYGQADVVIGNNVVAHIDDHHDLLRGVITFLKPDGAFIFEAPYLLDMFERLAFDSIYHEHLSYLSIRPLRRLMQDHEMEIFDVRMFPVQGESIRVFAGLAGKHAIMPSVAKFLELEEKSGLDDFESYQELSSRIQQLKSEVVSTLHDFKRQGKRIAGYGAPARGNTILNYYGIGPDMLEYATEELPTKIGRFTPGTHIPVIHVEESRKNPPDYYLLLAWNYLDAVLEKERAFRERGGKFILPVGETRIM